MFTIVNVALWFALFGAWLPYVMAKGFGDATSVDVMVILAVTAGLMAFLVLFRASGHRHILG